MKYIDADKLIAEINKRLMDVNLEELRYMFGVNMFGESIDCKQHLQELFGIDLQS